MKLIDVSSNNGRIDWEKVKAAGIDGVMVRAGWSWYEGGMNVDSLFHQNVRDAQRAGLETGAYLYSYDLSVQAAKEGAKRFLETIAPYRLTLPAAFDLEPDAARAKQKGREHTAKEAGEIALAALETIEEGGSYAMLYSCASWLNNQLTDQRLDRYDKWVAHVGVESPGYSKPYGIWQYSFTGRIDGISGDVDLNLCYQDYPSIVRKAGLNGFGKTEPGKPSEPEEGPGGMDTGSSGTGETEQPQEESEVCRELKAQLQEQQEAYTKLYGDYTGLVRRIQKVIQDYQL